MRIYWSCVFRVWVLLGCCAPVHKSTGSAGGEQQRQFCTGSNSVTAEGTADGRVLVVDFAHTRGALKSEWSSGHVRVMGLERVTLPSTRRILPPRTRVLSPRRDGGQTTTPKIIQQ